MELIQAGLGFFFIVQLTRALPWPGGWMQRKPLSCNVCMSGWTAIAFGLMTGEYALAAGAAGLCYGLLTWQQTASTASWPMPPE